MTQTISLTVAADQSVTVNAGSDLGLTMIARDRAEAARDVVLASAVDYPSLTAATSGAADGDFFTYRDAAGLPVLAKKVGGVVSALPGPWYSDDRIGRGGGTLADTLDVLEPRIDPATGRFLAVPGSAATPGYGFELDPDTGFARLSADLLALIAGGSIVASMSPVGLFVGGVANNSRLVVNTLSGDTMRGVDIYHKSNQAAASNQLPAFTVHSYINAFAGIFDNVGEMGGVIFRQAHNPAARPDKPSTFVGTGPFWRAERSIAGDPGTGGNLGTGNNYLAMCDTYGTFEVRGSDGANWGGSGDNAPYRAKSFTDPTKFGFLGYYDALGKTVLGSLNSGTAFLPLQLACSKIEVNADNTVELADASQRLKEIFCANGTINTSDAREKDWRGAPSDAEIRAAQRIEGELGFFRWTAAVADRGEAARLHFGVRAQRVWAIMAEEGLVDPIGEDGRPGRTPYAFLCFDEWEDQREPVMEDHQVERAISFDAPTAIVGLDGQPKTIRKTEKGMVTERRQAKTRGGKLRWRTIRKAGNRFGIRTEQLALFLAAGQAARLAALEAAVFGK